MLKENLSLSGDVTIELVDANGNVKEKREIKNLVVSSGLTFICSRMADTSSNVMSHMALGSSNTAAAANQTDLISILGSREPLDSTTTSSNTITYIASFEAGDATGAVVEAGLFNGSSGGTMLCRTVFPVVNKGAQDILNITWVITLQAS
tara:strand:+ start:7659 stop:8108 length:450 start_codon:yes stop_codon:yes gene_type:complete